MAITRKEVDHVADLARLELTNEQSEKLTTEMNDILKAMDKLRQLDTEGVSSDTHVLNLSGAFREDEVKPSLAREKALANAPKHNQESFVVPKVI
ncbi:Asp-tRNA(Asn)/Glu-tRNA(Gln) amidotransferase subunit GatC [Dethiosulfatarculus sandiegensis]|uniref:Aspartyl/glutamyl-tRNA(Asn/Gln) amidotransferase subunit C n=1 Tax=Dethiosulfatarculus sandiegensis TaxID=1429043 RepID=A0A0D2GGR7_9BACT|nr:Asp-tRNA(Asn)/Glu-tRNA(Gln) amidotransferase subunit GatC [Dethiosulfatarculus sandiegensis]KIX14107.1 glutamyl-tRNA amidotransferase subunit C [Dethiosulfatarculus sandiegensis]